MCDVWVCGVGGYVCLKDTKNIICVGEIVSTVRVTNSNEILT